MFSYWTAFATFFRIGAFTIGGGMAMLPLIENEVVDRKHWLDRDEFLDIVALSQTAPGIISLNCSVFIGYRLRGLRGSIVMALGTILPSFLIILAVALFFRAYKDNALVERIFRGIRPAVVALIASPTFSMARSARITRRTVWIPIVCAGLIWLLGFSPVWVIVAAGLAGYLYGRFIEHRKPKE